MNANSDTSELDKLIVNHLADLDATASRIDALGALVWREIGAHITAWADKSGWLVEADESDIYLRPQTWGSNESAPRYFLGWGPGDNNSGGLGEPTSWLARIVGVSQGQLCLWLEHKAGLRQWKPVASAAREALARHGFQLSDTGDFYADCTLDREALAEALANGRISDALSPINAVLNNAAIAAPLFTPLLKKAGQL